MALATKAWKRQGGYSNKVVSKGISSSTYLKCLVLPLEGIMKRKGLLLDF